MSMNKKIINRQRNIKKNLKGFLYLFIVFVGPQLNSKSMELDKMLSYFDKLQNINKSQITKEDLENIQSFIHPFSPLSKLSDIEEYKIEYIQQRAKELLYNLNRPSICSLYKVNLVKVEVDDDKTNKKIHKLLVRESLNGESILAVVVSLLIGLLNGYFYPNSKIFKIFRRRYKKKS